MIKIIFFARVRDQLGTDEIELPLPQGVQNVASITALLQQRGEVFESTLADPSILVAVNQEMASPQTTIDEGDEVAYFPPVTGG